MNKPNPDELLSLLVALARDGAPKNHIAEVFECAFRNSGAGSSAEDPFYLTPAQQYDREAGAILSRAGRGKSGVLIEDSWWVRQDADQRWIAEQTDNTDPKSWK